jgi:hypothetical protein
MRMGGYGSNRWGGWYTAKATVESSNSISVRRLVGPIVPRHVWRECIHWAGTILWSCNGRPAGSCGYALIFEDDGPTLTLDYAVTVGSVRTNQRYPIQMVSTTCHYGGVRWWFACPTCKRRVGTIHLPPGARRFACRRCHDLTYAARQDRRHYSGLLGQYSAMLDKAVKFEKLSKKLGRGKPLTPRQQAFVKSELGLFD